MSIAYLKFKRCKDETDPLVREMLQKYSEHIESYDIQDINMIDLSDPNLEAKERSITRKGGSLVVTIPRSFVKYLYLRHSSIMLFVRSKKTKVFYLFPVSRMIAYSEYAKP